LSIVEHAFPDHHRFTDSEIRSLDPMITTEKDAVKLVHLVDRPFWVVALSGQQSEFEAWLIERIEKWSRV
jgi:tetraacyldisaccharide 4'-kinase